MPFTWDFSLTEDSFVLGQNGTGGNLNSALGVKVDESSVGGNPWAYPDGGHFDCQNPGLWDESGIYGAYITHVYSGPVSAYSSAIPMGSLTPGYGRCYRMSFYLDGPSVGNEYQGASAVYTLGVNAAQIH
jgi:hypothetical protein